MSRGTRPRGGRAVGLLAGTVGLLGVAVAAATLAPDAGPPPAAACTLTVPGAAPVVLEPEQAQNATTIAAVARRLGMPDHAVTVAVATAIQESKLRNLSYGDRDSLGLFQQRPSQGWGTAEQVATPSYAAAAFLRRLGSVPGWQALPVTVAAQQVQRSAYPEAYGAHEADARVVAIATTGQQPAALTCSHLVLAPPRPEAARAELRAQLGAGALTATGAGAWTAASWLVAHAETYGLQSVTTSGRRWTASSGRWSTDPTTPLGVTAG